MCPRPRPSTQRPKNFSGVRIHATTIHLRLMKNRRVVTVLLVQCIACSRDAGVFPSAQTLRLRDSGYGRGRCSTTPSPTASLPAPSLSLFTLTFTAADGWVADSCRSASCARLLRDQCASLTYTCPRCLLSEHMTWVSFNPTCAICTKTLDWRVRIVRIDCQWRLYLAAIPSTEQQLEEATYLECAGHPRTYQAAAGRVPSDVHRTPAGYGFVGVYQ